MHAQIGQLSFQEASTKPRQLDRFFSQISSVSDLQHL